MSEWKEYKLGDIASFKTGKLNSNAAVINGLYPFFTCSPETLRINDYAFDQEAVLLAGNNAEGNFNIKYYIGKFNAYQRTYVISGNKGIDNKFLYYALSICLKHFKAYSQGTATKFLTAVILKNFSIIIPESLILQRHIASILSSLDDKIAVNKKICENLEAQAQALFKHWFVDFAPFKDGQFVESELGLIPEGWRVGTLGDIAELRKPSIKPQDNILYTHYSIPAFDNNKKPSIDEGSTIKSNKFGINDGAVLLSKLNPSTKRIWYTGNVPEHSVSSTEFLPFYSKNKEFTPFVYCYLNCDSNYREIANGAKGTTNSHQRIDANSILTRGLAYSEDVIRKFCDCSQYLMELILEANQESSRLSSLRDTLLPKLMSGQIKVDDLK